MQMPRLVRALPVLVAVGAGLSTLLTAPADTREMSPSAFPGQRIAIQPDVPAPQSLLRLFRPGRRAERPLGLREQLLGQPLTSRRHTQSRR
jgi:hypothetical protein